MKPMAILSRIYNPKSVENVSQDMHEPSHNHLVPNL